MEVLNINNTYDESDKPRYLTDDVIDLILSNLPPTYGADALQAEMIRDSIYRDLKEKMQAKKLAPSAMNDIANDIVKYHNTSRIAAGSDVGTWAGEGSSHAPTQAILDSHRFAGASRSAGGGFTSFEELFYTKKNKKYEICTLHYKNKKLSYEEVLETKENIIGCVISDFVADYLYVKNGNNYVKNYTIDMYQNLDKLWWHNEYYIENILETKIPPNDAFVLRIKLDQKEMFKFKVSIQDIVDTFYREYDSPIVVLYGPISDGIIDIYACAKYVKEKEKIKLEAVDCDELDNTTENDMINAAFYQSIIIPSLSTLRVKGVLGIRDLVPIVTPIISVVQQDDQVRWLVKNINNIKLLELLGIHIYNGMLRMPNYEDIDHLVTLSKADYLQSSPLDYITAVIAKDKKENPQSKQTNLLSALKHLKTLTWEKVHLVLLSKRRMRLSAIDVDMVIDLFNIANIKVLYQENLSQSIQLVVTYEQDMTVRGLINQLIKKDEAEQQMTRGPYTDLMSAAEYIYAEVSGTNLRGLMSLNFLDQSRLMSNNLHIVSEVLGVRASRNLFIKDLALAMASHGLHPQHIITIADVFFCRGMPTGAMNSSVNKQLGPVDKASVSKAVEVFKGASLHGVNHVISGISTNIAFGIAPKVGTFYMDIGYAGESGTVTNEKIYTAFKNERAYLDSLETQPVVTEDVNKDMYEVLVPKAPMGRKVNIEMPNTSKYQSKFQEEVNAFVKTPESTVPVSKYAKTFNDVKVPTSKYEKKEPVSKYAKEETKVPVSKYEKKVPVSKYAKEVKEETTPVSKYAKEPVKEIKVNNARQESDFSKKTVRKK